MLSEHTLVYRNFPVGCQKKSDENSRTRALLGGNFELKIPCMRESFWTTNWKTPVLYVGPMFYPDFEPSEYKGTVQGGADIESGSSAFNAT